MVDVGETPETTSICRPGTLFETEGVGGNFPRAMIGDPCFGRYNSLQSGLAAREEVWVLVMSKKMNMAMLAMDVGCYHQVSSRSLESLAHLPSYQGAAARFTKTAALEMVAQRHCPASLTIGARPVARSYICVADALHFDFTYHQKPPGEKCSRPCGLKPCGSQLSRLETRS